MTDIASVNKDRNSIYSDTGKTSPLSALPTSSPSILKSETNSSKHMTIDTEPNSTSDSTGTHFDLNGKGSSFLNTEERSKSIISDESSDLSDLDSEAETEKMYNGEESQLKRLSKVGRNDDSHEVDDDGETTIQAKLNDEDEYNQANDKFIKDDVIDELENHKNEDDDENGVSATEEISTIAEHFKKDEQAINEESIEGNESNKRKLNEDEDEDGHNEDKHQEDQTKRQKLENQDNTIESGPVENEAKDGDEIGTQNGSSEAVNGKSETNNADEVPSVDVPATGDEAEAEAGDEDEDEENDVPAGDEEEEEEDELTQEQKEQRQKELEIELEKQKERKEALEFLTEIEIDFAKLRDRLYQDKMERFKSELAMCLNGSHPELQTVYSKIDSHRAEKTKLAELERKYKLESVARKTIAQRTQVHQQFYKQVFDAKNHLLKEITEEWYKINKERRTMDLLVPEYSYKIPEYTDELVHQRQQLNQEISILVGLNQYYGFPKAPQLKPVEGDELNDDLRAMNIPI